MPKQFLDINIVFSPELLAQRKLPEGAIFVLWML